MSRHRIIAYPSPELMAQAVAARTLLLLDDLLAQPARQRADIAVTGGSDGTAILKAMAASPLLDVVDWSRVHVWWGDERFVKATDPERNAAAAREILFDQLVREGRMPQENVHEMPADSRSPEEIAHAGDDENATMLANAAAVYEEELRAQLGPSPSLDMAMFGLGPDGHFASLFPGRDEVLLDNPDQLVTFVDHSPKMPPLRLTMTVPMITRSNRTWICASRPVKARAVAMTYLGHRDPQAPASFADAAEELIWFTDADAAARVC